MTGTLESRLERGIDFVSQNKSVTLLSQFLLTFCLYSYHQIYSQLTINSAFSLTSFYPTPFRRFVFSLRLKTSPICFHSIFLPFSVYCPSFPFSISCQLAFGRFPLFFLPFRSNYEDLSCFPAIKMTQLWL